MLACVHYRTASNTATSRPNRRYQNCRKMVHIYPHSGNRLPLDW